MIDKDVLLKIKSGATVKVFERISVESAASVGKRGSAPLVSPSEAGRAGEKGGDKERISQFSGLVLARKHGSEPGATFTVRATVAGVGVERVFPIHSPLIKKVQILNSPHKVSRSKLYYLRDLSRKQVRRKVGTESK